MSTYWKQFTTLLLAGLLGIVSLLPALVPQLRAQLATLEAGEAPTLAIAIAAAVLQSGLLVAAAVALGLRFAPRLELRSHLVAAAGGLPARRRFRAELPLAVGLGAVTALLLVALDMLTRAQLGAAGERLSLLADRTLAQTVMGVLYGGITEELLMRWGLVSFVGFFAAKALPRDAALRVAILVAALLFGAGHLPTVAAAGIELSGPVVARTILLNGVAGLIFGWLYWRRSLEAAMAAHATVHVVWSSVALL